ncbi:MotA/TolQ/ExbB proton channel family protein [Sporomusa sp.]|uniref:MotA/TolQ/ExbB proton channel family protein n=1 Tax=Sporomusa sp. TaxID=2078658 RepID=UPI002C2795A1|nr:MotA/TolQ/ExbB proton channel family protein [Sporomusa sp.]HWR05993.1 MotA/TolQ/ExbB proton channel family protein [Sporomusa sp.]
MEGFIYLIHLFHKGGFVMYPLLICSLLAVMIAAERVYYYRRNRQNSDGLKAQIRDTLAARDWDRAIAVCDTFDTVMSRTVKAGLLHARSPQVGTMTVKAAFEERMAVEVTGLKKHHDYLSAIVTVAPLLGLLGTVIGMIGSFSVMDGSGSGTAAISGGVGEALVATAAGLCVAILAFVIHTYFSHQFDSILTATENLCLSVLEHKRGEAA